MFMQRTLERVLTQPPTRPVVFFSELATNASAHNVTVIIYSGNDDSVVGHLSNESE